MRAIIIGGGLAGLTAAISLRREGIQAEVFERAPEPKEVGAGIGLWGNAVGALRRIGLAETVLGRGEKMSEAVVMTSGGRLLANVGAAEFVRVSGEPMALVHRADLLEELLRPLPEGCVHFGRTLDRHEESADGRTVTAFFTDGSSATGDVLIGADGLKSRVRAQLVGDGPPRYAGYPCWRGVVDWPDYQSVKTGWVCEVWGKGARFGITRIGRGRVYWWATVNAPESPMEQGALDEKAKARLLESHGGFCEPVPMLLRATEAGRILRNDLCDRTPRRNWTKGRVLLIGDAAHSTTPNLGQGGCMAIEDGVRLAGFLKNVDGAKTREVEHALRSFMETRYAKTARVVRESRILGMIGQWENGTMRWGRDRLMSLGAGTGFRRSARLIGRFE